MREVVRRCPSSSSTRRGVRRTSRARNRDDCPRSRSRSASLAERGENCGQTVGYQVRFESSFSAKTRLFFATPGVLLSKLGYDPDLVSYTHFLLDEVHEEDRDTEFLLVALRELVARGKPTMRRRRRRRLR